MLRGGSSWWTFGITIALALFLLGDAVVRGDVGIALRALPPVALVVWLIWAVLVRPGVVVTRQRLEILNVWRRYVVPWDRIAILRSRFQLRAELDDGRVLRSWGAPIAGVDRAPRTATEAELGRVGLRGRPSRAALPPVDLVISRWRVAAAERDERAGREASTASGEVETCIEWRVIAITAALVLATTIDALIR